MKLKPLGWGASIVIFLISASVLRVTHYTFVTSYKITTGQPYLVGYLIGWISTMLIYLIASLVLYVVDGHPRSKKAFVSRYRLEKLKREDWIWTIAMIIFSAGLLSALYFTTGLLKSIPFFAPDPVFPPDLVDISNLSQGVLFEMDLQGKWWVVGAYAIGWLLNILGEEFWYRGWMLPRQEIAFGKRAWLVNGLMFNFQHIYMPWNLLAMLPGSLFVAYAVQRQRKTWMSIIWHGLLNVSLLFFIIEGVLG